MVWSDDTIRQSLQEHGVQPPENTGRAQLVRLASLAQEAFSNNKHRTTNLDYAAVLL